MLLLQCLYAPYNTIGGQLHQGATRNLCGLNRFLVELTHLSGGKDGYHVFRPSKRASASFVASATPVDKPRAIRAWPI